MACAENTSGLSGVTGVYTYKCLLDVWVSVCRVPCHVYGLRFPAACPNYIKASCDLFPGLRLVGEGGHLLKSKEATLLTTLHYIYRRWDLSVRVFSS